MFKFENRLFITNDKVIITMLKRFAGPCLENTGTGEWSFEISTVREAYQPVEGEGCVYDSRRLEHGNVPLRVIYYRKPKKPESHEYWYHKCILNIVTARAELRELVEKCEGGK